MDIPIGDQYLNQFLNTFKESMPGNSSISNILTTKAKLRKVDIQSHFAWYLRAQVAKLVDAPASGAGDVKVIGVRVSSWAPK